MNSKGEKYLKKCNKCTRTFEKISLYFSVVENMSYFCENSSKTGYLLTPSTGWSSLAGIFKVEGRVHWACRRKAISFESPCTFIKNFMAFLSSSFYILYLMCVNESLTDYLKY